MMIPTNKSRMETSRKARFFSKLKPLGGALLSYNESEQAFSILSEIIRYQICMWVLDS